MKTPLPLLAAALLAAARLSAGVTLPSVFSDHLVLQSGAAVAVWGFAAPKEKVTVSLAGQARSTITAEDGRWQVKFGKFEATAKPQTMEVKGQSTLSVRDVLIGEVWLGSGQSNMEMCLKGKEHGAVDHADEEIAAANFPQIRYFAYDTPYSIYETAVPPDEPLRDRPGKWYVCSPETAANFYAIGYFFSRTLHQQLHVPVGFIGAAVGGTPIEAWTTVAAQTAEPALKPMLEDWDKRLAEFDPKGDLTKYEAAKKAWLKQRSESTAAGQPAPKAPSAYKNIAIMKPGRLYNGVIAPIMPFTVRGVLWYQGERNAAGPFTDLYGQQLEVLVKNWRALWGEKDLYFAWMQLANVNKVQTLPVEPNGWGTFVRDGQRRALSVPHTNMAISIDLGGEKAGHPTNKAEFAQRITTPVLHDIYGHKMEEWTGPLFREARREGASLAVSFDHAAGLKAKAGELKGFAVAGEDRKFAWADAKIANGKVILTSDKVQQPVSARYDWASNPIGNLVNAAGYPASPFRSDDWPPQLPAAKK